jgi:hypothetical protein
VIDEIGGSVSDELEIGWNSISSCLYI